MKLINRPYNILHPVEQVFNWGTIRWLDEPEDTNDGKLLVGHVAFLPQKMQDEHLHTGDEQILYIISGKGEHRIDNQVHSIIPGMVYHIPAYAKHEIRNVGDEVLEMIIVYNPSSPYNRGILSSPLADKYKGNETVENLNDFVDINVLQEIQDQLSEVLNLAIVIKDKNGQALTQISNFPEFCERRCEKHIEACKFRSSFISTELDESTVVSCCYDAVSISNAITFGNQHIGNILCGPVFLNEPSKEMLFDSNINEKNADFLNTYLKIRKITKGRLYAIIELLKTINNYIVQTGIDHLNQKSLHQKTLQVLEEVKARNQLEKALSEAKMKAIEAQMSPHFLFNTLSVIGEMAYMNGAKEAAEITFSLSNLLRKSLRKSQELVSLKEEIEYIEDYVFIQQKRFRNIIKTDIQVEEKVLKIKIPFMSLQILVENAIVHGLHPSMKEGILTISAKLIEEGVILEVIDNGIGISEDHINKILFGNNNFSVKGSGLGFNNLRKRLNYYYGGAYKFDITSIQGEMTKVSIVLPIESIGGIVD